MQDGQIPNANAMISQGNGNVIVANTHVAHAQSIVGANHDHHHGVLSRSNTSSLDAIDTIGSSGNFVDPFIDDVANENNSIDTEGSKSHASRVLGMHAGVRARARARALSRLTTTPRRDSLHRSPLPSP